MTKFESNLNLSLNLQERRMQLRNELNKTITEIVTTSLRESVRDLFNEVGIEGVESLNWDFYPESDDEGGSVWYVDYVGVSFKEGVEKVDLEEVTFQKESWRKDGTFWEANLMEELREIMCEFSRDLYDQDITEIELV
ncbi:hypothetical protein X915_gp183 [Bacillus phage vB_BanS-Tsamsa]|uniref:Uncharacterized protein n=1 Tax=Bacillus phage vB_BanS-Tsamsa TaxID=1308863 RepID=U5J9E3_9CAUD|nr:hypothetical protein X915_gp183 [Bacillus phage vB_BanS-Tsamsa]AGI11837.1 hypothetical protein [Bacillus phage vB_BanS-Tsamsa]